MKLVEEARKGILEKIDNLIKEISAMEIIGKKNVLILGTMELSRLYGEEDKRYLFTRNFLKVIYTDHLE